MTWVHALNLAEEIEPDDSAEFPNPSNQISPTIPDTTSDDMDWIFNMPIRCLCHQHKHRASTFDFDSSQVNDWHSWYDILDSDVLAHASAQI